MTFIRIWGASAMLAGAGYSIYLVLLQRKIRKSRLWPSVTGQVESAGTSRSSHLTGPELTPNRTYRADIKYKYMVGSRVYVNSRIFLGGQFQSSLQGRAKALSERFASGSRVPVFYNPENPQEACLDRSCDIAGFGYLIGGGFFLFGLLVTLGIIP